MSNKPKRVNRGSCWVDNPREPWTANRDLWNPGSRSGILGIRLVEVVDDESASKSTHPHIPRSHRFVRGGSWRFLGSKNDRKRVYPRFHTSENVGIRLVEVFDDPESAPAITPNSLRASRGGGAGGQPGWARTVNRCLDKVGFKFVTLGIRLVEIIEDE